MEAFHVAWKASFPSSIRRDVCCTMSLALLFLKDEDYLERAQKKMARKMSIWHRKHGPLREMTNFTIAKRRLWGRVINTFPSKGRVINSLSYTEGQEKE